MRTNEELIRDYKAGDADSLNQLVKQNMGLIKSVASGWVRRRSQWDDVFQECSLAFLLSAHGFDFRGRFTTFAVVAMKHHMINLKIAASAMKRKAIVVSLDRRFEKTFDGESPIADYNGHSALRDNSPSPLEIACHREEVQWVDRKLRQLNARTRKIILSRMTGCTRPEIGNAHGLSPQRIQQIELKGMRLLREMCSK